MRIIALTGGIATGKSTTAKLFAEFGIPVFDADAIVHELYENEAIIPVTNQFPQAIFNGVINRQKLWQISQTDKDFWQKIEAIIHPLVQIKQHQFIENHASKGHARVVLDIPLLFETGRHKQMDCVVLATTTPEQQRLRALARQGMSEEKLQEILARQIPLAQKRARSHASIDTSINLASARVQVHDLLRALGR